MKYRNFADFVGSFSAYDERPALTIRPFVKIERLTYGELQRRSYQVAHYLQARGVRTGDRVMVAAANSPAWVKLFFGAQLIGAVLVPVDAGSTADAVLGFAGQTRPKLIFKNKYTHSELDAEPGVCLLDELDEHIADCPHTPPDCEIKSGDMALIVFTSGTTADPKGVVLTQANVLANVEGVQQALAIDADWRLLSVLPLSHMYELTGGCLVPLSRGASIFYVPRVTPATIADAFQEYRITTVLAIPQLLILLLQRIRQTAAAEGKAKVFAATLALAAAVPFPVRRLLFRGVHARLGGCLNLVVTGGAPIPIAVGKAWERMGVKVLQGYGLTETAPILTVNRLDNRQLDSPGLALSNVRVRIGDEGEIQAKGPNVFAGYWHKSAATKAAFTPDGWFRTGDIGRLRNGWLQIQGRLKFAVVLPSGLKVFPEDIEQIADSQAGLQALCAVGVKQADGEESVQAVVVSDASDRAVDAAIADINARLASFQHISGWRRWPDNDFPRTRLMKIDRKQVQAWANTAVHNESESAPKAPKSDDRLFNIIRMSLDDPKARIRETDRLADIALDSLRRLSVSALIEEQFGVTLAEEHVTHTTTVAQLRRLIANARPVEPPKPRPVWTYRRGVRLIGNGLCEAVIRALLGIWVSIRVEGRENLDGLDTPTLFIFNHIDNFDAPVVYRALPHRIRKRLAVAAADDVLREHRVLAFVVRLCYAGFNLKRSEPYLPSLQYVGKLVDGGWHVALAPEGRMSKSGKLQPFKSGIGLLAVELGVPVVPVKTLGLFGTVPLHAKWPKRHSRVTVRIGQPVRFSQDTDYDDATAQLQKIMEEL